MKKQIIKLKSPFGYYGGKQLLAKRIISLIPPHRLYTEVFFGGGAVYFRKEPSEIEVINDTHMELINFYTVLKHKFNDLYKELETCLHSRLLHKHATVITDNPEMFSDVKRAWAIFIRASQSFNGLLNGNGSWQYDKTKNINTKKVKNKIAQLTEDYAQRLQLTQIECADAIKILTNRDAVDAFHYVDPPYYNADMGHYSSYTKNDFENLLIALQNIKGKFILSSYQSDILSAYTKQNNWHTINIERPLSTILVKGKQKRKRKIEVLTANYPISLDE